MIRWDYKNRKYNSIPTFKECFDALERRMDDAQSVIDRLQEENTRLREEAYKDKELVDMQNKLKIMHDEWMRGFSLTEQEANDAHNWIREHNNTEHNGAQHGAIGGGYEYRFIPTGIGTFGEVVCSFCGAKHTFQEP